MLLVKPNLLQKKTLAKVVSFQLIALPLILVFSGASLNDPSCMLDAFLANLNVSEASLKLEFQDNVDGHENSLKKWVRFHGKFGVEVTKFSETALKRWVWNPDYVALLESSDGMNWVLTNVIGPSDAQFKERSSRKCFEAAFLGGPLVERIEIASISDSAESTGDTVCCEYLPGSALASESSEFNKIYFRFDRSSIEPRLLEVNFQESLGDSQKIVYSISFEYPGDSLLPVQRVVNAVVNGGLEQGSAATKKVTVESDTENNFRQEECFLSYYGLPEPDLVRTRSYRAWLFGAAALSVVALVVMYFRSRKTDRRFR